MLIRLKQLNPVNNIVLSPTDFVALANQTLEYAFGFCQVQGEVSGLKVSKSKWVYFSLKDELAKVDCFASVYALPGPIEDGMVVRVAGTPRLHPQYGFSLNVQNIVPAGEGTLKKAFELLRAKLDAEGLFDPARKQPIPFPPQKIALITSVESAAYADFIKIIGARWPFVDIIVFDTQVQGDSAPLQISEAIYSANSAGHSSDLLVLTRGGGSADDLSAYNDERVVRAVASSRMPTVVAIGHELDISLSELAADLRASTPSNAAELIVPDKLTELAAAKAKRVLLAQHIESFVTVAQKNVDFKRQLLKQNSQNMLGRLSIKISRSRQIIEAYNPHRVLKRGYSLVHKSNSVLVRSSAQLKKGESVRITFASGQSDAKIISLHDKLG